ncbi:nucleotide-binding protein [Shewanella algae]|uniref:nucleotide-binding protein n=1 Tax=Shewanella algae TaxID=38313 RepID=UPI0031F4CAA9
MFIRAHEAGYMCVATLSERDLPVLASERCPYKLFSSGRTIIEKIEHYSDVGFAIVLYTPDDVGNVKSEAENLNVRARQNVVFEHGYLIGRLGRENVSALVDGKLELPNDISGVVYINLDEGSAWQLQLAKEMKQSGYDIDMNKLI